MAAEFGGSENPAAAENQGSSDTVNANAKQGARYDFAFDAAQVAAVALMCAMHDTDEIDLLEALRHSRNLSMQLADMVSRMEESPAFIGFIHSGLRF